MSEMKFLDRSHSAWKLRWSEAGEVKLSVWQRTHGCTIVQVLAERTANGIEASKFYSISSWRKFPRFGLGRCKLDSLLYAYFPSPQLL